MKTKILSGFICCLGIFSANAQTITAPVGQSLTVTNPIDVTGGGVNILIDNEFKIGGIKVLSNKGTGNIFVGGYTGDAITTGTYNSFIGFGAGQRTTSGVQNLFIGVTSGTFNTTGSYNSFLGINSGYSNTVGTDNTFIGGESGYTNTTGNSNTFIGVKSGRFNSTGIQNTFIGGFSGYSNSTGKFNAFIGFSAGSQNTTGEQNLFLGTASGSLNTVGNYNSFVGINAGANSVSGEKNIFIGGEAGYTNTTGSSNTYIGYQAQGSPTLINATAVGANSSVNANNTIVLGSNATTITGQGLASGSGLRFANITNASPATPGPTGTNGKVLSVDGSGNVILVQITGAGVSTSATGPVAESWKESDGYLYNNSTNGVVIKGTGLDGNSLIVKGGVLSKEVNVKVEGSESWPDYVFKPNYKRMTLGEVEKFISINGHLPNIPSATEMAKTGNNLGQTDVKLLEKVEELTLYLLDMKKANDAQAAELKALKQQISKLRKK